MTDSNEPELDDLATQLDNDPELQARHKAMADELTRIADEAIAKRDAKA